MSMPRHPRIIEHGLTYHLISRFVDREWFIEKANERELYLKLLGRSLDNSDWRLTSYAIMSNHIHLQCIAGHQPLADWIRPVHAPFADAMNRARNRIGCVFVRGPKAFPVERDSFGHLLAYIHNNPVRAGVCSDAAGTDWTSHRAYVGRAAVPPWLHVDEGLARAGFDNSLAFDAWVNDPERVSMEPRFSEQHYAQASLDSREAAASNSCRQRSVVADMIACATADLLGVSLTQVRSSSRSTVVMLARAVAVRCAIEADVPGQVIARALHLSPARVSALRKRAASREVNELAQHVRSLTAP
jgi:hypothetical protein